MSKLLNRCGDQLASFVTKVVRYKWIVIACVAGLVLAGGRFAANNLGINTDTANMISAELPWRQDFNAYRERFPARDRNIVVVIDSESADSAKRYASLFAQHLRAEPQLYLSVFLAGDGEFFARNGLLYLSVDELEALGDQLAVAQPMIGQISQDPTGSGVVNVLTQAVGRSSPDDNAALASLQENLARVLDSALTGDPEPLQWAALISGGESEVSRQLVLVRPQLDFAKLRPARDAIERMRAIAAEMRADFGETVSMRMTGTLAMEHEELDSVVRSASAAGILALLMVAAVLYWSLRSVRLLVVAIVVLLAGLTGTAALAAAMVGHLNLLSVAFAVLYVGLGVDFILHISLRVKELIGQGHQIDAAIVEASRGVGASIVVCSITTAAGFYAFVPTPFQGVSELGLISGTGMFVSLFVSVTLLPALLSAFYRGRYRGLEMTHVFNIKWMPQLRPSIVISIVTFLVLVAVASMPFVTFDSNPVNLRDPQSESVVVLQELAASSDAELLTMVALADDEATAQQWARDLRALPDVAAVVTIDSLVADEQDDKLFVIEDIALLLGPGLGNLQEASAKPDALQENLSLLMEQLQSAELLTVQERELLASVMGFFESGQSSRDDQLAKLDAAIFGDLREQLQSLERSLQAERFGRSDLPRELTERWFSEDDNQLIEIVPAENISENVAASRFVDAVRSVLPSATGYPVVYREAASTVVISFQMALVYAVILVAAVLLLFLRSLLDCALVLVPILCAAIVTAGMTVWLSMPFNFANIIALPLLIGVGVDNAIHMVHRIRTETVSLAKPTATSTSVAVFASGLTTIASFGNLGFSTHRGMATMGVLLTLGMVTTMLATLVFLPALMRLRVFR